MNSIIKDFVAFAHNIYKDESFIPLHRPVFTEKAKNTPVIALTQIFVSSVGQRVTDFEKDIVMKTGAKHAIATVNGTSALHTALLLGGVAAGDEVITQAVSFVATCNAIKYCNANPIFIDVSRSTLGMNPSSLKDFLIKNAKRTSDGTINIRTGNRIAACVPMHTFGHSCEIDKIVEICDEWAIPVVEDAAESLGSYYKEKHTGTFGKLGIFSFNGNKIVTTGGGGMIVTNDEELAVKAKHITTTAKKPHAYEYSHDCVAFNYRLPNLNAALGCEQMENLDNFLEVKRDIAYKYECFFKDKDVEVFSEPVNCRSNYWLNAILLNNKAERDSFLEATNSAKVMTRPLWGLLNKQTMYKESFCTELPVSNWLEERVVNIPSSVPNDRVRGNVNG